jgi:predicted O-methyltransferase YrrM
MVKEDGIILDVGTAFGGSAFCFSLGSKSSVSVYTIDPRRNELFIINKEKLGLNEKLIYIQGTTDSVSEYLGNKKIDLVFIDGLHTHDGVMNDFEKLSPFLDKGSIVIFHDYFLYRNTVGSAICELKKIGRIRKIKIIDSLYQDEKRVGMYISEFIK